jgi:hypothetical protein
MVVIMIGVVAVHMRHLPAVEMIGQGVRRFGFFLFGHPVRGSASSSPALDRASIVWRRKSQNAAVQCGFAGIVGKIAMEYSHGKQPWKTAMKNSHVCRAACGV